MNYLFLLLGFAVSFGSSMFLRQDQNTTKCEEQELYINLSDPYQLDELIDYPLVGSQGNYLVVFGTESNSNV